MSKTWKWILGILGVVLLLGVIWCASFVAMRTYGFAAMRIPQTVQSSQPGGSESEDWRMPMHDYYGQGPMPHHQRGYGPGPYGYMGFHERPGFMPFGMGFFWLGGLFRLIVPLGFIALILLLGYKWGQHAGARSAVSPAAPSSASESSSNSDSNTSQL